MYDFETLNSFNVEICWWASFLFYSEIGFDFFRLERRVALLSCVKEGCQSEISIGQMNFKANTACFDGRREYVNANATPTQAQLTPRNITMLFNNPRFMLPQPKQ